MKDDDFAAFMRGIDASDRLNVSLANNAKTKTTAPSKTSGVPQSAPQLSGMTYAQAWSHVHRCTQPQQGVA